MYCFLQLSHLSQEGMSQFTDEAEADVTQLVGGCTEVKTLSSDRKSRALFSTPSLPEFI